MANQLAQLADLLRREDFGVQVVAVNPPLSALDQR
jgi:hypothetical protein